MKAHYEVGDLIATPGTVYRVDGVLGSGGMGHVVSAVDKNLNVAVVIKLLHPDLLGTNLHETFEQEARAIAQIGHANVVRVIRLGTTDEGLPFYVMEHLLGRSVRSVLKAVGKGLPLNASLNIVIQVLQGLEAVHDRGIVHRDVKPDNVILLVDARGEHVAKLIDFGVMKIQAAGASKGFAGTPAYAAPEQWRGPDVDERTDVFATGVMLFEMLTGRRPFARFGRGEKGALARLDQEAEPISDYGDYPPALVRAVARALAPKIEDRFRDAFSFAATLKKISNALAPVDAHEAVTDPGLIEVSPDAPTASRAITLADVAAPTDPDGDLPAFMVAMREKHKRDVALGYMPTEQAASPHDTVPGGYRNSTEPLAGQGPRPGGSPRRVDRTVPMADRPLSARVSGFVARIGDLVTNPPRVDAEPPPSYPHDYVDPPAARERTPRPADVSDDEDGPEGADRSAARQAATMRRRQVKVFLLMFFLVLVSGLIGIALGRTNRTRRWPDRGMTEGQR